MTINWTTQWHLNSEKDGGGIVTNARKWYDDLENAELTAVETTTHEFVKWVLNDSANQTESTMNPFIFQMYSPRELLAVFAIKDGQTLSTKTISMQSGWNLKSFQRYPESTQFNIALNNSFSGKIWTHEEERFLTRNYLSAKTGYWIYSEKNVDFDMIGVLESNPVKNFKSGWNLFGPLDVLVKPNESVLSGTIWFWNAKEMRFQSVKQGDNLLPGFGYWIYAIKEANINCLTGEIID